MCESLPLNSGVTVIYITFLFSCNDNVENIMEIIQTEHKNALLLLLLNFFHWMIVGVCLCGG